ncbi:MAG: primosomal protein N' [Bacilli bacterium]|nr:primosomal protein N' [Bacilli bacterium]
MIAGVLVELSNKNIDKIFEYDIPSNLISKIKIGIRVLVPFGNMKLEGFVLSISGNKSTDKELRSIIDVIDDTVVLNDELLELGKVMQKNTLSTLISCYQVMLPKALKAKNGSVVNVKYDTYYKLSGLDFSNIKFNDKQMEIINLFNSRDKILRQELVSISSSSVNTLLKKGVLIEEKSEHYRLKYSDNNSVIYKLTSDQESVVSEVINNSSSTYLLHGVTGSGKTEVYMAIIEHYLSLGKTCIVLVPEISLTPQMVSRFQNRFGDKIAAIHSALSDGEKYDEWRRIYRGEASIVIGARSAIFAPLKNIGVIIIDEEHSDSYKQSDPNPRYSAKDIALIRAKYHDCSVIFGSATPSLEAMARANKGVYKLLSLPNRVNGKSLPKVKIIDMNMGIRSSKGHFSLELLDAINKRIVNNEQVILLLNRRGYSSFVTCRSCGYTYKCPNCDITLTYHKSSNTLRCHYCGYGSGVSDTCPSCKEKSLNNLGVGTQKIEEEINKYVVGAKVLRMDYDTTSRKGMHEKMINSFKNQEYNILLGTQMVAKGLDFSNVTLVGVINADTSLNIPDFRSSENTFSLLSQVAGRSGRSEKEGEVFIQTYNPDHYAISLASKHDYLSFFNEEMKIRKQLKYPPYCFICNIRISGKDALYIYEESCKIKRSLDRNLNNVILLGPSTCSLYKINNIFRYNIIIKYRSDEGLYEVLEKIIEHYKSNNKIKIDIDFNPSQMM